MFEKFGFTLISLILVTFQSNFGQLHLDSYTKKLDQETSVLNILTGQLGIRTFVAAILRMSHF